MGEPSDGEAFEQTAEVHTHDELLAEFGLTREELDDDENVTPLASLTGVPEGVGPKVNPGCPICTGGRGIECAWHFA